MHTRFPRKMRHHKAQINHGISLSLSCSFYRSIVIRHVFLALYKTAAHTWILSLRNLFCLPNKQDEMRKRQSNGNGVREKMR